MSEVKIELQPAGNFLIHLASEQYIKGRFSMYALNRFCEQKGNISYLELWEKITIGMKVKEYAELILFGLQDFYREDVKQCPWTTEKIMDDIIDPVGGLASKQFLSLVKHAVGRVAPMEEEPAQTEAAGELEAGAEKKNI